MRTPYMLVIPVSAVCCVLLIGGLAFSRRYQWTAEYRISSCKRPADLVSEQLDSSQVSIGLKVKKHLISQHDCAFLVEDWNGANQTDAYVIYLGQKGPYYVDILRNSMHFAADGRLVYIGRRPDDSSSAGDTSQSAQQTFHVVINNQEQPDVFASIDAILASHYGNLFDKQTTILDNTAYTEGYDSNRPNTISAQNGASATIETHCSTLAWADRCSSRVRFGLIPGADYRYVYNLVISPDGKHVAYIASSDNLQNGWLAVIDRSEGEPYYLVNNLQFSADSKHVSYQVCTITECSYLTRELR